MAGITSVTVTYPLDLIRTRLSVQAERQGEKRKYRSADVSPIVVTNVIQIIIMIFVQEYSSCISDDSS